MTDQRTSEKTEYAEPSPLATGELVEVRPSRLSEYKAAVQQISPVNDLKNFARMPCAASSMLLGILTGGSVLGITMLSGRPLHSAMRWGASGFAIVSIGMHYQCSRNMANEKERMKFIVDHLNRSTEGMRNLSTGHNVSPPPRNDQ